MTIYQLPQPTSSLSRPHKTPDLLKRCVQLHQQATSLEAPLGRPLYFIAVKVCSMSRCDPGGALIRPCGLLLPSSQVYSHDLPAGGMSWHQLLARPAAGLCAHMLYSLLGGLFVPPQRASAKVEWDCEHQWWSVLGSWAAASCPSGQPPTAIDLCGWISMTLRTCRGPATASHSAEGARRGTGGPAEARAGLVWMQWCACGPSPPSAPARHVSPITLCWNKDALGPTPASRVHLPDVPATIQ